MILKSKDLRDLNLLKYYRLVRKWACKTYNLKDADLELLIYLDCKKLFTRNDFINGVYTYSWDKNRWERLRKQGWIDVYSARNRTTNKYNTYTTSYKCKNLIILKLTSHSDLVFRLQDLTDRLELQLSLIHI